MNEQNKALYEFCALATLFAMLQESVGHLLAGSDRVQMIPAGQDTMHYLVLEPRQDQDMSSYWPGTSDIYPIIATAVIDLDRYKMGFHPPFTSHLAGYHGIHIGRSPGGVVAWREIRDIFEIWHPPNMPAHFRKIIEPGQQPPPGWKLYPTGDKNE